LKTEYGLLGLLEAQEKDVSRKRNQKPKIHKSTCFLLFLTQIPKSDLYFRLGAFQSAFGVIL